MPFFSTGYRGLIELLFSILIIAILSALAIREYMPCRSQAIVAHFAGYRALMADSQVYFSLNGTWPKDLETLDSVFMNETDAVLDSFDYIKRIAVRDGAFDFTYGRDFAGEMLTLRPAVPSKNPLGPVIWVAGEPLARPDWQVFGSDQSTVSPFLINNNLK